MYFERARCGFMLWERARIANKEAAAASLQIFHPTMDKPLEVLLRVFAESARFTGKLAATARVSLFNRQILLLSLEQARARKREITGEQ